MTDISAAPSQAVSPLVAPAARSSSGLWVAAVRIAMAFAIVIAVVTPDREIAAKVFKANMMIKNLRQRIAI